MKAQLDVDLRPEGVAVRFGTHGPVPIEGESSRSASAAPQLRVLIDLTGLQAIQLAIDSLVIPEVLPF